MTNAFTRIADFVKDRAFSDTYAAHCRNVLMELSEIDTTASQDPAKTRAGESATGSLIEASLREILGERVEIQRHPISSTIESAPGYVRPSYAGPDSEHASLSLDGLYEGRCNLIARLSPTDSGASDETLHLQAHVDSAGRWFPPRADADRVVANGAADGKGAMAALLAHIRLLEEARSTFSLPIHIERAYAFTIDATVGGVGPLACSESASAGDRAIVLAPTGNVPYFGCAGRLSFQCRIDARERSAVSELQILPFVVGSLVEVGRTLAGETRGERFGPTSVGLDLHRLRSADGRVTADGAALPVLITLRASANPQRVIMHLTEMIDACLRDYAADATASGSRRAYTLTLAPQPDRLGIRLDVRGPSGRRVAPSDAEHALRKGPYLLAAMVRAARNYPNLQGDMRLAGAGAGALLLEGTLTFSPTHTLGDVRERFVAAVERGARTGCELQRAAYDPSLIDTHIHAESHESFAVASDGPAFDMFRAAFRGLNRNEPDARMWSRPHHARYFGCSGVPTVLFGPGNADAVGRPDEHITTRAMQEAVARLTLATLHAGSFADS